MPCFSRAFQLRKSVPVTIAALSAAAALWSGSAPVLGQEQVIRAQAQIQAQAQIAAGGINPDSFQGKESNEGVFVRDSALAVEKLALAQRMERLKEWDKSADLYQEILEKYADRVVPSQVDDKNRIYQYTSVVKGVQDQLAKWPEDGRNVYRARYEAKAAALLESAKGGDLYTLNQILAKYFTTDSAKAAGSRLLDYNLEHGEFLAAARVGDLLLDRHPGVVAERPSVLFRTALAYHLAGDDARSGDRLKSLQRDFPQALGTIRGKEVVLSESLATELKGKTDAAAVVAGDSYRMLGGDESRSRISPAKVHPGAKLYSINLNKPDWQSVQPPQKQILDQQYNSAIASGMTVGVIPAIDRGEMYFQDGRRAYAVSLESGVPLPGWSQTYPQTNGQYSINAWGSARMLQHTLTLTDTSVLAVMGQPDKQALMIGMQTQGDAQLVCLDRATGKQNWAVSPGAIDVPKEFEQVKSLQFTGSPLVVGDNVLVAARTNKMGQQFEDCWVLSFDLSSGKFRWSCYVASANVAGAMFGIQQMAQGENTTHLAYADGRVYCMTNLGALAALDAYSGTIIWLNIYPRDSQQFNPNAPFGNPFINQQMQQAPNKPWSYNPVMVRDGKLFAMPTEGKFMLVYDASTGIEAKRIKLSDLGEPEVLLGVRDNTAIVCSDRQIIAFDWTKYDPETFNSDKDNSTQWRSGEIATHFRGRGFVTQDAIFITAEDRLNRYNTKQWSKAKLEETFPSFASNRSWKDDDSTEGPGNVVVTSDYVVIAGADRVDVYTDLGAAKKKLDAEVAAAPHEPQPRLRYAEVMFVSSEPDAAMVKMDEAIELLGGRKSMAAGLSRDRVFNDAMTFAQKLSTGADAKTNDSLVRIIKFFDRASSAASNSQQQVNYRLARAKWAESNKDGAEAVRLYQEILADQQLRPVPLLDEANSNGPVQAEAVAERNISEVIAQAGASIYAPYQQAAQAALEESRTAKDPARLLAVAQMYPNATVAPTSMLLAAESYESAKSPRQAIQVLRQMFFKYPASPDKPRIVEALARNYLKLPNRTDIAAAFLEGGAKLAGEQKLSKPLDLPGGKTLEGVTFSQALDEVRKLRSAEASKHIPSLGVPVPPRNEDRKSRVARNAAVKAMVPVTIAKGIDALVDPVRDFQRPDRVVAWSKDTGLSIFESTKKEPLGISKAIDQTPRGLAWVGDEFLIWGPTQIAIIGGKGGPARWSMDLKQLAPLEVVKAGDAPQAPAPQLNPNQQLFIQGRGRFIVRNGQMQQLVVAQPAVKPAPNAGETIVEARPVGDRVLLWTTTGRMLSADLKDGHVAWQTRLADRPFDRVLANEEFIAAKASAETQHKLFALDTYSGQIRYTKSFNPQTGMVPVNIALSMDGKLIYTMPDRLVLKSLLQSEDEKQIPGPQGQPPYQGATGPDQLLISEGRILALADSGAQAGMTPNEKYVRVHSLETGQPLPLRYRSPDGDKEVDRVLTAGNKNWDVQLRVVGPHLYVIGSQTVISYNLDRPAETWKGMIDPANPMNIQDVFIGQDFLGLLDKPVDLNVAAAAAAAAAQQAQAQPLPGPVFIQPGGVNVVGNVVVNGGNPAAPNPDKPPAPAAKSFKIHLYGRYPVSETNASESGRLDYVKEITDTAGITDDWQSAEGAFYFLTVDGRLQMLEGSPAAK